jgi:trehalose-phosphatase
MIDDSESWLQRVRQGSLALLLDLDGTLIPFEDSVETAAVERSLGNLLDALAYVGIRVVIVSGRKLEHLERVRTHGDAWWVAEYGAWRRSHGEWEGPSMVSELDTLVASLARVAAVEGVVIERKSLGICVHWRLVSGAIREQVIEMTEEAFGMWLDAHPEYERLAGIEAVEVRHRSVTKAHAVGWVREQLPGVHVIAIGDGEADEDMFAALTDGELAIAVRNARIRQTRARASLSNPTAVREFLWWLIEARSGRETRPPPFERG